MESQKSTIWILTEEKPKASVVLEIIKAYCKDFGASIVNLSEVKIKPLFDNGLFTFQYLVEGIEVSDANSIRIKTVSGNSSFVDFLLFKQDTEPNNGCDKPLMSIEETKTQDGESRNTGVYQRATKFAFIKHYYENAKTYMLYNGEGCAKVGKKPSPTNIFGTNLLLTIGVNIIGKDLQWYDKFTSVDEIIKFKSQMNDPRNGNRIELMKDDSTIYISCKLDKKNHERQISHDPNIGMVSLLSYAFRTLGWTGDIVITNHNIEQKYVSSKRSDKNKFVYICSLLSLKMAGLDLPHVHLPETYWHYEMSSEKMASILLHVQAEYLGLKEVYQNHAGCERGYFKFSDGRVLQLPKKAEDGQNLLLPDVVLRDDSTKTIVVVEGKKLSTIDNGLKEICEYGSIESEYIDKEFSDYTITRGVSIFGGELDAIPKAGVIFYLNKKGRVFVSDDAPECIKRVFHGIIDISPFTESKAQ